MSDERGIGLYQSWNEDLRKRYIKTLDDVLRVLRNTPQYPFTITEWDVEKLMEALIALNELDDENLFQRISQVKLDLLADDKPFTPADLYDQQIFTIVKGVVLGKAMKKVEKEDLKPGNPVQENLEKVFGKSPDLSILKKNIWGDKK